MKDKKLPEGWKLIKLDDLLDDKITGEWGTEDETGDGVYVLRTTNFTNEGKLNLNDVVKRSVGKKILDKKKLKYGDIILEKSGGSDNQPVGRVVYFNINNSEPYLCNNFTQVLRANEKIVNSKYLLYYLLDIHKKGVTEYYQNKTTGIRNLQVKKYLELEVPIPSLGIQKRIICILEKAERAIEKRKEAIKLLDELVKSRFIEMFGNPMDNKFESKTLPEIIEKDKNALKRGPFGGSLKKDDFIQEGYLVYEQRHAIHNDFEYAKYYISKEKYEEMIMFKVKPKDLLVSCSGVTLGRISEVPEGAKAGIINQALLKITLNQNIMNNIYFINLFRNGQIQDKLFGFSRGSGIPNFPSMNEVKSIKFLCPPIDLQNQFAAFVNQVDKLKFEMQQSLEELENSYQSLMQKAFKGELFN